MKFIFAYVEHKLLEECPEGAVQQTVGNVAVPSHTSPHSSLHFEYLIFPLLPFHFSWRDLQEMQIILTHLSCCLWLTEVLITDHGEYFLWVFKTVRAKDKEEHKLAGTMESEAWKATMWLVLFVFYSLRRKLTGILPQGCQVVSLGQSQSGRITPSTELWNEERRNLRKKSAQQNVGARKGPSRNRTVAI